MEEAKEIILNRLFALAGVCFHCNKKKCAHTNRKLPDKLSTDIVLKAINLNEQYEKEQPNGQT